MATAQKQDIDLNITKLDMGRPVRAILVIETSKALRGGVESDAKVMWEGDHFLSHAFGLAGGGDFSKKLTRDVSVKATQKAIDSQFSRVFTAETLEALIAEAKAYYASSAEHTHEDLHGAV